jgi:hypothetical protein
MKRILCSIGAGLVVCLLAWLSGFDFSERGDGALFVAICALIAAGWVYAYPGWEE